MKMCNSLIDDHPLLIQHHAGLGDLSSAAYYAYLKQGGARKTDLDWILAVNRKKDSLSAIVVNTTNEAKSLRFKPEGKGYAPEGMAVIEKYTCDSGKADLLIPPGDTSPFHLETGRQDAASALTVPPQSVTKITFRLKTDNSH